MSSASISASAAPVRIRLSRDDIVLRTALVVIIVLLAVAVVFPLLVLRDVMDEMRFQGSR